jgi:hypothetical protein
MTREAIEAKMTARLNGISVATLKETLAGLWTMKTAEAALVRGVAYRVLVARIGDDAADEFTDGLATA